MRCGGSDPTGRSRLITPRQSVTLPFDPCVGEFLFGATIYGMRRDVLDAESARARGETPATEPSDFPTSSSAAPDAAQDAVDGD